MSNFIDWQTKRTDPGKHFIGDWSLLYNNLLTGIGGAGVYFADYTETNHAVAGSGRTIYAILDGLTLDTDPVTIVLPHNEGTTNTDYHFTGTRNFSAYTGVRFIIQAGARFQLNTGVTVTLPSPECIEAGPNQQIFTVTGTGKIVFDTVGRVYPNWWLVNSTPGTTNMTTAFQAAVDSMNNDGGWIQCLAQEYLVTTIDMTWGLTLAGMGKSEPGLWGGTTIIGSGSGYTIDFDGTQTCNNVLIKDLTLEDNADSSAGAIRFNGVSGTGCGGSFTIDRVDIVDYNATTSYAIKVYEQSSHVHIRDVRVWNTGGGTQYTIGLHITNTSANLGVWKITNVQFGTGGNQSLSKAVHIEEDTNVISQFHFDTCTFNSASTSIELIGAVRTLRFTNCRWELDHADGTGILVGGHATKVTELDYIKFSNCVMAGGDSGGAGAGTGVKYGIRFQKGTAAVTVRNFIIDNFNFYFLQKNSAAACLLIDSGVTCESVIFGTARKTSGWDYKYWIDTDGGNVLSNNMQLFHSGRFNVTATETDYPIDIWDASTDSTTVLQGKGFVMPFPGSVIGVYSRASGAVSSGTATITIDKNYGTDVGLSIEHNSGTGTALGDYQSRDDSNSAVFDAGDSLRFKLVSASLSPTTIDFELCLIVDFNLSDI